MKTIIYILFCIAFNAVRDGEISKSKYLEAVSTALKNNLLSGERAFKLTMKVITL